MATLHLMVGLPCSGKTTYAKELAERERALLLTPDSWQRRLFGGVYHPGEAHKWDALHTDIEAIMWDVAKTVLPLGVSVILDFGFWTRAEREEFRARAAALEVDFKIHYMNTPREELFRRLEHRNANPTGDSVVIPPHCLREWCALFEPPGPGELSP